MYGAHTCERFAESHSTRAYDYRVGFVPLHNDVFAVAVRGAERTRAHRLWAKGSHHTPSAQQVCLNGTIVKSCAARKDDARCGVRMHAMTEFHVRMRREYATYQPKVFDFFLNTSHIKRSRARAQREPSPRSTTYSIPFLATRRSRLWHACMMMCICEPAVCLCSSVCVCAYDHTVAWRPSLRNSLLGSEFLCVET